MNYFVLVVSRLKLKTVMAFLFERLLDMNKDRITGLSIFSFHYIIVYPLQ